MKLIDYLKTKFDHIVVFDYEFQVKPGDNPKAVSLTAKDLISGRIEQQWLVGRAARFPLPFLIPCLSDTMFLLKLLVTCCKNHNSRKPGSVPLLKN